MFYKNKYNYYGRYLMFDKKLSEYYNKDFIFSVIMGVISGLILVYICIIFDLSIWGFKIYLILAPLLAGFVETYFARKLTNNSSGAVSSIVLFLVTNGIGWLFPTQAITWNIFTIGGIAIMLQAAFPLAVNCILIFLLLIFVYVVGKIGGFIGLLFNKNLFDSPMKIEEISNVDAVNILILNNQPNIPIKKYHGLIFAEEIFEFEEKTHGERIEYLGSDLSKKKSLKHKDYLIARDYILSMLEKEAIKVNANAIIDIEIEYTNYNQQFPPDMLMAAYGTAVTIDEKYDGQS